MKDKVKIPAMFLLLLSISQLAMANCGTTDYSGSTGRLYDMVTYVLTMCSYVAQLTYVIATLLSFYCAILTSTSSCKQVRMDLPRVF